MNKKTSALRRIVRNDYAFTIGTKVAALFIGLVSSSFSKRFLGPALVGELGYIDSTLTVVAIIAQFGLYQPYPFHKRQQEPDVLNKFLNIFALQFLVYAVIGVALAIIFENPVMTAICLIAPIQVLANQFSFIGMVEDVKYKNVVFFTARIVNTTLMVTAFYTMSPSLLIALLMIVIGDVITVVLTARRLGRFGNPMRVNFQFLRGILAFGFVAMLTTLLVQLNYKLDEIMLKWMGIADVQRGFYNSGASIASYGWLVSDAFREVLFSKTSKDDAINDVSFSLKLNFYITLLMLLAVAVFGQTAIRILYGVEYLPSFRVTLILLFGIFSMSYFKLIGTLLLSQGKKYVYMGMLFASVVANVAGNLLAIPIWGIEGAAAASVLSYTVAGGAFLLYFVRTYHVSFLSLFVVRREELKRIVGLLHIRK